MSYRLAIIIPAFDASDTLAELLRELRACVPSEATIVIDDGSQDGTAEMAASAGAVVIRHARNQGKGAALRTGFRYVLERSSFDAVVTMDADLQHSVGDLPAFIRARDRFGANIVLGSRRIAGTGMPLDRRISNIVTSFLVSIRAGVPIKDSQCGYRLIGTEVLRTFETEANGFEAETEFLIRAARSNFHIVSIPVQTIYRNSGSHMTKWKTTKQFVRTLMREF